MYLPGMIECFFVAAIIIRNTAFGFAFCSINGTAHYSSTYFQVTAPSKSLTGIESVIDAGAIRILIAVSSLPSLSVVV
jgi:hypothetical protein